MLENIYSNLAHNDNRIFINLGTKYASTRILATYLEQNVSIVFVNNVYIGNIRTVWHRRLYMRTRHSSNSF